jgi:hypothetical protein
MITLTLDKHDLVKAGFSMKDLVQQGPGWSTSCQIPHLGGLAPPPLWKGATTHGSVMGLGNASREALDPRLIAAERMTVQEAG